METFTEAQRSSDSLKNAIVKNDQAYLVEALIS